MSVWCLLISSSCLPILKSQCGHWCSLNDPTSQPQRLIQNFNLKLFNNVLAAEPQTRTDLMRPLYKAFNAVHSAPHSLPFKYLKIFKTLLHFSVISPMCVFHVSLLLHQIPKYKKIHLFCFISIEFEIKLLIYSLLCQNNPLCVCNREHQSPSQSPTLLFWSSCCTSVMMNLIFLPLFQMTPSSGNNETPIDYIIKYLINQHGTYYWTNNTCGLPFCTS